MKKVNQERVNNLIEGIAKFGSFDKGVTRLAYSQEDFAAQKWLLKQKQIKKLMLRKKL